MDRNILMRPRFSSDREDWVQKMVSGGHAVCIMSERTATLAGIISREKMELEREVVFVTVSGSGTPVELRQVLAMTGKYDW